EMLVNSAIDRLQVLPSDRARSRVRTAPRSQRRAVRNWIHAEEGESQRIDASGRYRDIGTCTRSVITTGRVRACRRTSSWLRNRRIIREIAWQRRARPIRTRNRTCIALECSQLTASLAKRWDIGCCQPRKAVRLLELFEVCKEERLILPDGPTDAGSVLILLVSRVRRGRS